MSSVKRIWTIQTVMPLLAAVLCITPRKTQDKPYSENPVWQSPLNFGHWCVSVLVTDKIPLISRQFKNIKKSITVIHLQFLKERGFVFNISDKKIASFCCRTFQSVLHNPFRTLVWGFTALINYFSCSSQMRYQQSSTCVLHYETLMKVSTVASREKTKLQLLKQGWMESARLL